MQSRQFQQALKSRHLSLIALGGIVGSAYFLGTGYLLSQVGPAAFLAYILGGLITFLTMSCLSELTLAVPEKGSFVLYAARYISPSWACGVGWSYWMTWVVYIPSECLAAGMIMQEFFPSVSASLFAMLFGLLITGLNLSHVKAFGEVQFWLALIKVGALALFSIIATLILFGVIGNHAPAMIGTQLLTEQGGFFPKGGWVLLFNMVLLLVNFQGSEIIGLSASETKDALKTVPKTLRQVVYRIIGLYLIPTLLVAAIFPWHQASLHQSVFSLALASYGFPNLAGAFTFVILTAALSCANGGLYGTVRSLHALSNQGMAPRFLTNLNKQGVPGKATLVTLAAIWIMLALGTLLPTGDLFKTLLGISGFTGAICWISICWSQLRFRKLWLAEHGREDNLPFRAKGFPYLSQLSIWLQILCLLILAFHNELRSSLYIGIATLCVPLIWYHCLYRRTFNWRFWRFSIPTKSG